MTTEDDGKARPDAPSLTPKNVVPLKDRLSLSPQDAADLTGIGLTSIKMATYSGSLVAGSMAKTR